MRWLVAALGGVLVLGGIALAALAPDLVADRVFEDAVALVLLAGAALALWKLLQSVPSDANVALPPWVPGGAIVHGEPERTPTEHRVSATEMAEIVAAAGTTAREEGTIEDGLAVLEPPLRDVLLDALVQGGMGRDAAERALRTGEWTDNDWAAYVIEPALDAPSWTLRQRFRAWLFPEETIQRLARETVHAVAAAADEAIPPVPGQGAPRTVPVTTPSIATLQRGADGELQEAIEPTAIARGTAPPSDHHALDEAVGASSTDVAESTEGPTNDDANATPERDEEVAEQ